MKWHKHKWTRANGDNRPFCTVCGKKKDWWYDPRIGHFVAYGGRISK